LELVEQVATVLRLRHRFTSRRSDAVGDSEGAVLLKNNVGLHSPLADSELVWEGERDPSVGSCEGEVLLTNELVETEPLSTLSLADDEQVGWLDDSGG
jgi:hypothetical protein